MLRSSLFAVSEQSTQQAAGLVLWAGEAFGQAKKRLGKVPGLSQQNRSYGDVLSLMELLSGGAVSAKTAPPPQYWLWGRTV